MKEFHSPPQESSASEGQWSDTMPTTAAVRDKLHRSLNEHAAKEAEHRQYRQEIEEEFRKERLGREEFLNRSEAQPTPAKLYTLWLYTYLANGGEITHQYDHLYRASGMVTPTNTELPEQSVGIPTGYGAKALNILAIPQLTPCIDTSPTSRDERPGWEYGHTTLLTLEVDETGKLQADTNHPNVVASWPEINELLEQLTEDPSALQDLESLRNQITATRSSTAQAPSAAIEPRHPRQ